MLTISMSFLSLNSMVLGAYFIFLIVCIDGRDNKSPQNVLVPKLIRLVIRHAITYAPATDSSLKHHPLS